MTHVEPSEIRQYLPTCNAGKKPNDNIKRKLNEELLKHEYDLTYFLSPTRPSDLLEGYTIVDVLPYLIDETTKSVHPTNIKNENVREYIEWYADMRAKGEKLRSLPEPSVSSDKPDKVSDYYMKTNCLFKTAKHFKTSIAMVYSHLHCLIVRKCTFSKSRYVDTTAISYSLSPIEFQYLRHKRNYDYNFYYSESYY